MENKKKKNFMDDCFVRVICNLPCDYLEGEIVKESSDELWLQELSDFHNLYKIPFTSISTIESIGGYHE